jgi:hypothetical protein
MRKSLVALGLAVALGLGGLAGCAGQKAKDAKIEGTYQLTSVANGTKTASPAANDQNISLELKADGKVGFVSGSAKEEGTYTVNGDKVTIDDGTKSQECTVKDAKLTCKADGQTMVFTKK